MTQFQGQILRAATNNRACTHADMHLLLVVYNSSTKPIIVVLSSVRLCGVERCPAQQSEEEEEEEAEETQRITV